MIAGRAEVAVLLICLVAGTTGAGTAQPPPDTVPYVPTAMPVVAAMLELAGVGADDLLHDLGSGDGRIVVSAAGSFGTRGIGYEIDPSLVAASRAAAASAGVDSLVSFVQGDLFDADLTRTSVVSLYLSPELNLQLRPKLLGELEPGARVVSHAFHMGDWSPDSTVHVGSGAGRATLHLWLVPADVNGFWELEMDTPGGAGTLLLEVEQSFQELSASLRRDGSQTGRLTGVVRGRVVQLELEDGRGDRWRFHGRVGRHVIEGTYRRAGREGVLRWRASRFSAPDFR